MNEIKTRQADQMGYQFVDPQFLPTGADEYYLRNIQNDGSAKYRSLTSAEVDALINHGNSSDDWSKVLISDQFLPELIKNCRFFGLVRIGNLLPVYREFHDFRMAAGIYDSTIISCDFGDNVCIHNVSYMSHYIIGKDVMIANVHEFATTNSSKFGNGIVKDGEEEKNRTRIEVCNEAGDRSILPFDGMLPGDAYLWSRYREDSKLLECFTAFTQQKFDSKRGYYGKVGERTVIKNCGIIKDTWIGADAYLKGANKLKNLTINSDAARKSQIGEGCELVNGIVGFGCRVFYGVKAVRFVLASHSQLKYGARLINSYLGNNSTISCCEVLNSLIFPFHEQHHNNSFLCAALVMGQSNIAAGATIGSNHNSRSADGEIQAGRGFWPGLCVSLKHNSKFASFTLIAKGDFPTELNIPVPFCLVSNDVANDGLIVMPGYWFMYNMYALERNTWKYGDRDNRTEKIQLLQFDYLAPDTINELFTALKILRALKPDANDTAFAEGWQNSNRKTTVLKVNRSIALFEELISYYAACAIVKELEEGEYGSFEEFKKNIPVKIRRSEWQNIGGQLIRRSAVKQLREDITGGTITDWNGVHDRYRAEGQKYRADLLAHAFASLQELKAITIKQFTPEFLDTLLNTTLATKEWMTKGIYESRAKDYTNPYRKMVYETTEEMNKVLGRLEDNTFIQQQYKAFDRFKATVAALKMKFYPAVAPSLNRRTA